MATATVEKLSSGAAVVELGPTLYSLSSVALALIGVYLARLVSISEEDKKLGRRQTLRETGPLTWIGLILVGPIVWFYKIDVPLAAPIGLGVGYAVKIVLRILGAGATGFFSGIVKQAANQMDLDKTPAPSSAPTPEIDRAMARLNDMPDAVRTQRPTGAKDETE